jgi:hypothetical protein
LPPVEASLDDEGERAALEDPRGRRKARWGFQPRGERALELNRAASARWSLNGLFPHCRGRLTCVEAASAVSMARTMASMASDC